MSRAPHQLSPDQRQALLRSKLSALVADLDPSQNAAKVSHGVETRGLMTGLMNDGARGYVLSDVGTPQSVAGAMSWLASSASTSLVHFVDLDGPAAARFSSYFRTPSERKESASALEVREVTGATSVAMQPDQIPARIEAPEAPQELLEVLIDHGLEVVSEHGVTRGEILGLEVARLVTWPLEAGGDDTLHLEVGVGRFDRDATWAVRDGDDLRGALDDAVAMVRKFRGPDAPPHPLGRLQRERWLRQILISDPHLAGATQLHPVAMTLEQAGMKDPFPAAALGADTNGQSVIVVASVGVNLAAVPLGADLRAAIDPTASLVLAVPTGDIHPAMLRLASMLDNPATVVEVPNPWTRAAGSND